MYLSRIRLRNIRCFESLDLRLDVATGPTPWCVIVGDNATGKTALLRSIAIGLCDEASAAGLMKESDEGYIRRNCRKGWITLDLVKKTGQTYQIRTEIERVKSKRGSFDRVRQTTSPKKSRFPWKSLFVAAYGAGRGVAGTGDIAGYTPLNAVYNLFNYSEGLQNPELMLWRHSDGVSIEKALATFTHTKKVHRETSGVLVDGPWGKDMPLRDLADGYKGAILWLADLLGWAVAFESRLGDLSAVRGVVLVDELEMHMHARWQRTVIADLRRILPGIQFITTTHSPLIASSVGMINAQAENDKLFVLELRKGNSVTAFDHQLMQGWRMDQVLASRAFQYEIHADPEFRSQLRHGSELLAKEKLSREENSELLQIKKHIRGTLFRSNSPIERAVESEVRKDLRDEIKQLEQGLFPDEQ